MTSADVRGYRLEVYRDPDDGSWVAEVPDLPGCVAGGATPDEAVTMVSDAIDAWVSAALATGRSVPASRLLTDAYSGRFVLRVTRSLHAQLARLARQEGVSLNAYCAMALAEAAGTAGALTALVPGGAASVDRQRGAIASGRPAGHWPEQVAYFQVAPAKVVVQ